MLVEADAADEAIALRQAEPHGIVRVTCPVALREPLVGDMFAAYLVRHPRVALYVESTDRRVDVIGENVDIAIRVRPPPLEDSELVLRVLSDRGQCLVASPALLEQTGLPESPADLATLPSLAMGAPQGEHTWRLLGPDAAEASIRHQPRLVTRNMAELRTAAIAGVGVVQLPRMMVRDWFAAGELTHVLPGWEPRREIIHAVYPSRRGQLPAVRALLDWLVAEFQALDED